MMGAPSFVSAKQLKELNIRLAPGLATEQKDVAEVVRPE
jgi:hypothetical protein